MDIIDKQTFYFGKGKLVLNQTKEYSKLCDFKGERYAEYSFEIDTIREMIPECYEQISFDGISSIAKCDGGWLFSIKWDGEKPYSALWVSKDYTKAKYYTPYGEMKKTGTNEPMDVSDRALDHLRTVYDAILPLRGGSVIHSSCVKYRDRGVMFLAPSKTGKSTQMRLWNRVLGAESISSDAPVVFPTDNGLHVYGMPWDGSDQIKVQTDCDVIAMIELRQAKYNALEKLSSEQAFNLLMKQGHMPMWDQEAMFHEMLVLKKISEKGRFYRLSCLPNEDAVRLVERVIFEGEDS